MKKILIVGNSFFPEKSPRSYRTTELAKEFAKQGHDVTVLIPKNNKIHKRLEKDYNLIIRDLGYCKYKDIETNKGSKLVILFKRILRRGLDYFFHFPNIQWAFKVRNALKKEGYYDLLITIAYPHPIHWGTALMWNKQRIASVWAADCGDPFMGSKNDTFKKMFYFKYVEKYWCRKTNYIVVPIEEAKKSYYPEFQDKIRVIPQGFTFPKLNRKKTANKNMITFVYSGTISPYRHYYIPFFELLNSMTTDFKFIVFTKEEHIYRKYLKNIHDKVEIHKYIERDKLLNKLMDADFLIYFPYQDNSQRSLKLIDYTYSGTPVLSYKGKSDDITFHQFLNRNFQNKLILTKIDQYKIENVCNQFLKLIS